MPGWIHISPPATPGGVGPTLLRLRNLLADELGWYQPAVVSAAAAGDTSRFVLSDELRDDEDGYTYLDGSAPWVYVRNGDQAGTQRRVIREPDTGYQGSPGLLMVSRPFDAPLEGGTVVEITSPLPVARHLGVKGLNECINEGLARVQVAARLTMTGNGTYSYDLASLPILTDALQMRGIYDSPWNSADLPPMLSGFGARIVQDGVTRTLVTDVLYSSSDTWYLDIVVSADRLVYDGISWAYITSTTPGLLADDYQTAAPEQWALAFSAVMAFRFLTRYTLQRRDLDPDLKKEMLGDIADRRLRWARVAASIKMDEFPKGVQQGGRPMVSIVSSVPTEYTRYERMW